LACCHYANYFRASVQRDEAGVSDRQEQGPAELKASVRQRLDRTQREQKMSPGLQSNGRQMFSSHT
jgi:hypothetical protein